MIEKFLRKRRRHELLLTETCSFNLNISSTPHNWPWVEEGIHLYCQRLHKPTAHSCEKVAKQGPFLNNKDHSKIAVVRLNVIPAGFRQNSISTNWEANRKGGFLDLSRPMYSGRSCKIGRFRTDVTYWTL